MSLKQDIEMVKEELTSEEKFFEKAVVTEKFVKKYKNVMIGSVVAIALFVAGNIAYSINKQDTIDAANKALSELQLDANNKQALARLASLSPALSDAWVYSQAIVNKDISVLEKLKNSKTTLISELAEYGVAQNSNDSSKLQSYAMKQNVIYKDLAQVQSAVLLINDNKVEEARKKLGMISIDSPLAQISHALMHYGVK